LPHFGRTQPSTLGTDGTSWHGRTFVWDQWRSAKQFLFAEEGGHRGAKKLGFSDFEKHNAMYLRWFAGVDADRRSHAEYLMMAMRLFDGTRLARNVTIMVCTDQCVSGLFISKMSLPRGFYGCV
jgi:hypothetical protein